MDAPTDQGARLVVLLSGRGTNLGALLDACSHRHITGSVVAVFSDRADAGGLQLAARAGIHADFLDPESFARRADFDAALADRIAASSPDLLLLAGYMRILTPAFVHGFRGRMLNIHPSLLPAYRGLHTYRRALLDGVSESGASVHFVTEELDGGPVVLQARVPVLPGDDETTLADRIRSREHLIYPEVVSWYAAGRLRLIEDRVMLDGRPLPSPCQLFWDEDAIHCPIP